MRFVVILVQRTNASSRSRGLDTCASLATVQANPTHWASCFARALEGTLEFRRRSLWYLLSFRRRKLRRGLGHSNHLEVGGKILVASRSCIACSLAFLDYILAAQRLSRTSGFLSVLSGQSTLLCFEAAECKSGKCLRLSGPDSCLHATFC